MRVSTVPEGGYDESVVTGEDDAPSTTRRLSSYIDITTSAGNPGLVREGPRPKGKYSFRLGSGN